MDENNRRIADWARKSSRDPVKIAICYTLIKGVATLLKDMPWPEENTDEKKRID